MYKYVINGEYVMESTGQYKAAVAIYGNGTIKASDGYETEFRQGQGVFLPADFGKITFNGNFTFICFDSEQINSSSYTINS
jgi:mannose-6-phosphate isomerase class I